MSEISTIEKIPNLAELGNVIPEGYIYYKKKVTSEQALSLKNTALKWYNIYPPGSEITIEENSSAFASINKLLNLATALCTSCSESDKSFFWQ